VIYQQNKTIIGGYCKDNEEPAGNDRDENNVSY